MLGSHVCNVLIFLSNPPLLTATVGAFQILVVNVVSAFALYKAHTSHAARS